MSDNRKKDIALLVQIYKAAKEFKGKDEETCSFLNNRLSELLNWFRSEYTNFNTVKHVRLKEYNRWSFRDIVSEVTLNVHTRESSHVLCIGYHHAAGEGYGHSQPTHFNSVEIAEVWEDGVINIYNGSMWWKK